ncbi:retrovirus-related pol polyprotein from transposon TNT 1-94 [Tanacetum coccineum]
MGQEITKMPSVEPTHTVPSAKVPASKKERYRGTVSADDTSKPILQNRIEFVQITKKTSPSDTIGNVKQIPALKLGQGLRKSKIQTLPKTPIRRPNTLYPKSDYHQVRLKFKLEPDEWIKDSGCSRHMTGNKYIFSTYEAINGGNVVYGSNKKSKIIGKGQIYDKKCKVLFSKTGSEILKDGIAIGRGISKNGLYVMKIGNSPKDNLCLTSINDTLTLWHQRLGHANMRLIQSLSSKELVRNLPNYNLKITYVTLAT